MAVYYLVFFFFAFLALSSKPRPLMNNYQFNTGMTVPWFFMFLALVFYIGFRYDVGGDWGSYKFGYWRVKDWPLIRVLTMGNVDPGFGFFQWVLARLNQGFISINIFSSAIFAYGLIKFCKSLPRPYLAIVVALPYLINVVAMGYVRQSIAIGVTLLGLLALFEKKNMKFFFLILIAATFHKSSVIFFPLAIFVTSKNRLYIFIAAILLLIAGYIIFVEGEVDRFLRYYVGQSYSSSGGAIRVAMLLVPSTIFLLFRKKFVLQDAQKKLWTIFALMSYPLFFAVIFLNISTTVDRVALYALPIQLFVFSYLPDIFKGKNSSILVFLIICYYALVLFVWLNFANHAQAWVPYDNVVRALWDQTGYFDRITT